MTKALFGTTFSLFYTHTSLRTTKISGIFCLEYQSPYCLIFLRHMERISPLLIRQIRWHSVFSLRNWESSDLYSFLHRMELYRFPLGTTRFVRTWLHLTVPRSPLALDCSPNLSSTDKLSPNYLFILLNLDYRSLLPRSISTKTFVV